MPAGVVGPEIESFKEMLNSSKPVLERLQPKLVLNDGNQMPMLGLGTWNAKSKEVKDVFKAAIYCGYRHIDTATYYKNEHLVGEAIAECLDEKIVNREDLFVTTKLWNNSHSRASVPQALKKSLKELGLTYVDLYLIHYPIGYQEGPNLTPVDERGQVITSDVDYVETWLGMEDVKREGLAKSIGVSNFSAHQLTRIMQSCSITPAINQVECHPYLNQSKLLQFCRAHKIELTAYSPLGSPERIDPRLQEPYLMEDPLIKYLAKKYSRSAAHILIRYQLQRDIVVIPKAATLTHIKSNFQALSFELSKEDMIKLGSLDRGFRTQRFARCSDHKYYPFNDEF